MVNKVLCDIVINRLVELTFRQSLGYFCTTVELYRG